MDGSAPPGLLDLLSALAEPTRLKAMRRFSDGAEHCACELVAALGATQSRVSRHMGVLLRAGLIVGRRDGPWVRYRINPALEPATARLLAAVLAADRAEAGAP